MYMKLISVKCRAKDFNIKWWQRLEVVSVTSRWKERKGDSSIEFDDRWEGQCRVQGNHQAIYHERQGKIHLVFHDNQDIQSDNISQWRIEEYRSGWWSTWTPSPRPKGTCRRMVGQLSEIVQRGSRGAGNRG